MTPTHIDEARRKLGLSVSQMAAMLDTGGQDYRRWMMSADKSTARAVPARVYRLINAYLAGYRPPDWPVTK